MNYGKINVEHIIIVVVLAVVTSLIWLYLNGIFEAKEERFIDWYETEIQNLKDNHTNEKEYLEEKHTNETNQLKDNFMNETKQLENEKEKVLNQLTNTTNLLTNTTNSFNLYIDGTDSFVRNMKEGVSDLIESNINKGCAEIYYDEACDYYSFNSFFLASIYAGYADVYYGYASGSCELAEGHFKQAVNNAPSEHLKTLASLYVGYADYGAQVNSEMHEANEYFASACNYYYLGDYETGDNEIEKMNEHIIEHDRLVPLFNDVLADIEAWW